PGVAAHLGLHAPVVGVAVLHGDLQLLPLELLQVQLEPLLRGLHPERLHEADHAEHALLGEHEAVDDRRPVEVTADDPEPEVDHLVARAGGVQLRVVHHHAIRVRLDPGSDSILEVAEVDRDVGHQYFSLLLSWWPRRSPQPSSWRRLLAAIRDAQRAPSPGSAAW